MDWIDCTVFGTAYMLLFVLVVWLAAGLSSSAARRLERRGRMLR